MSMSINATGRAAAQTADAIATTRATAAAPAVDSSSTSGVASASSDSESTSTSTSSEPSFSSDLKTPAPRHFPWLSRLTSQLESSSAQKSPFSTQPTGETLNQSA